MTPRCHRTPVPCTPVKAGANSANENQFAPRWNAAGYVDGGSVGREKLDGPPDITAALARAFPLDPADIVPYAPGWSLGMTAMEYERQDVGRIASQAPNGALPLAVTLPVARSA